MQETTARAARILGVDPAADKAVVRRAFAAAPVTGRLVDVYA